MKQQTKAEYEELGKTAQELIKLIVQMGYTCKDIENGLNGRVSYRTLYRWMGGTSLPKRKQDVIDLAKLYKKYSKDGGSKSKDGSNKDIANKDEGSASE